MPSAALVLVTTTVLLAPPSGVSAFSLFPWSSPSPSDDDAVAVAAADTSDDASSASRVTQLLSCVWRGSYERSGRSAAAPPADELSGRLDGEDSVRSYPAYPHAPLLVAAATCDRVELRWKSFEDAAWPVHQFVLQRFPDLQHRGAWATLLETSGRDGRALLDAFPDASVRAGQRYSYRVQAISAQNVSSAFAVHEVVVGAAACSSGTLYGLLPARFPPSWSLFSRWSCDAVRTLALLVLCFLSVFALMRAYGRRVQGAGARSSRLKRIHKSASENTRGGGAVSFAPPAPPKLTQRSSSDSSTSPPSEPAELQLTSQRSIESRSSVGTRESFAHSDYRPREASLARDEKASACQNCQKRFGVFRRRHPCDICRAVTLCRRCGYQAPAGFTRSSVSAMDEALGGRRSSGAAATATDAAAASQRSVKIKTICRGCCEEVYRYSTSARARGSSSDRRRRDSER